jgi:hypothetical protein
VRAQSHGFRIFRIELLYELSPEETSGAELGNFHEVIHADGPEKAEARCKFVDVEPGVKTGSEVFEAVGEGVGEFEVGGCSGFLHVIAGNGDAVELRHVFRTVAENVADNAHGAMRRIDVGVANHEFLEDVVLDGAGEFLRGNALLFGGDDVEGHDREDGAVHGHGDRPLIKGDLVEEDLHVFDGIDSDSGFADVTGDAGVIGIVAAVRSEIESYAETPLACGEIATIKGVGIFGR